MKFVLGLILLFFSINEGVRYEKIFGKDYRNAVDYFIKNKKTLVVALNQFNTPKEIIIPVIFPEKIRYSLIQDLFETEAVKIVYVNYGSKYVDFSIGDFQLKPSFAENIEKDILKYPDLKEKYQKFLRYKQSDLKEIRKNRTERLESLNFQLIYISAFYDIVTHKFDLKDKTEAEKIQFIASCFNSGYHFSQKEIEKHIAYKYFPYGKSYKGPQYAYTKVALYFSKNQYKTIFP